MSTQTPMQVATAGLIVNGGGGVVSSHQNEGGKTIVITLRGLPAARFTYEWGEEEKAIERITAYLNLHARVQEDSPYEQGEY